MSDLVHHPQHYDHGRFGDVECIQFTRYMTFCAGNAFKYIWRHADKGTPIQDLEKAHVYLAWAIEDGIEPWLLGCRDRLRTLAATYLSNPGRDYYSLTQIIDGDYGSAIYLVRTVTARLSLKA